jgi:hypothetical protein
MPPGQQITFEPALALVLAEHRIQHASGGGEKFVILHLPRIPLTPLVVGHWGTTPGQIHVNNRRLP